MGEIAGVSLSWGLALFSECAAEPVVNAIRIPHVNRFDRSLRNKTTWNNKYDPLIIGHMRINANLPKAMANALAA